MKWVKLKYVLLFFASLLLEANIYGYAIRVDSFPEHYLLIDSLGYDYESDLKRIRICEEELKDPYWKWWDRTGLYQAYFISAVYLFLPIHTLKSIWLQEFENDPHNTCRTFYTEKERISDPRHSQRIPTPEACLLLREKEFFEKHCAQTTQLYDPELQKAFKATEKTNILTQADKKLIEQTINTLGVYPGRSYIGIDNEALPWFIIARGDVNFMNQYLPYIEKAVMDKELHPQFLAMTIDKIAILENRPQIYGTQYEEIGGQKKYYPIADMANINKLRRSIGLGIFGKSYNIYDTVILGKQYRD